MFFDGNDVIKAYNWGGDNFQDNMPLWVLISFETEDLKLIFSTAHIGHP